MFRQMFEEKYMRFPCGKSKAVTFSYDDGVKADKKLVEVFKKYSLKGTFNLNSLLFDCESWHGRMDEEQTYSTFFNTPHEVALHGARHIFLDKVPLPEAINEIVQNRVYLENKFSRIVNGMAYAYNGYNDGVINVLPSLGVEYARTTEDTRSFNLPENFYLWHPTCHHTDPQLLTLADRFLKLSPEGEFKHREPLLFYVWGHSYEFDDDNTWNVLEELAQKIANKKDIWYATNIEICNYVKAYRSLVFSMDGERVYNPSSQDIWIDIRGKVYKIPSGGTVTFDK